MDPNSGRLYTADQVAAMSDEDRAALVEIIGTQEQVQQVSRAVSQAYRARRTRQRKASKVSRRANRGKP